MKKLLTFAMLSVFAVVLTTGNAFAGVDSVLNEIGSEADTIGSWVYGGLFAIIGISGAFMAGKQMLTGQADISKALQIIGITVTLIVMLTVTNEVVKPIIFEQAKSTSTVKTGW